jgi:hypothetical protein
MGSIMAECFVSVDISDNQCINQTLPSMTEARLTRENMILHMLLLKEIRMCLKWEMPV